MLNYFADENAKKLVNTLQSHISEQNGILNSSSGVGSTWSRNLQYYYGNVFQSSDDGLEYAGEQGEIVKIKANQLRSLAKQFISLVSRNRLNFQATSQTSDTGTLADTRLINGLLTHIVGSQKLDILGDMLLEHAVCTGAGYLKANWNTSKGRIVDVTEDGFSLFTGDLELSNVLPTHVIFDVNVQKWDDLDWCMVKVMRNRWDLVAQFPELKDQILKLPEMTNSLGVSRSFSSHGDNVYVYEFYHRYTPAMPKGRLCVFGDENTVFFDDINPYKCIPVVQCKPEPIFDSPWGYTFLNDLVPLQELFDMSMSTAASNISAYGVQSMLTPEGSNIGVKDIGGMNWITFKPQNANGGGTPQPLQMPQTPPDVWKFGETIKSNMMEISNINSTLRGAPPSNVTSGTMAATLSANAVDFASTFAKAYYTSLESLMAMSINIYRNFANEKQIINLVGSNKASTSREFVGKDIPEVSKVTLRVTSPLLSTSAGVSDVAEKLLQAKLIRTPQEFLEVITTGNLETLYDAELSELELINAENDELREGRAIRALNSDLHNQHICQHKSVINDPKMRILAAQFSEGAQNPPDVVKAYNIAKAVTEHIMEHLDQAKNTDPMLTAILQTGAMPAPQPQQG